MHNLQVKQYSTTSLYMRLSVKLSLTFFISVFCFYSISATSAIPASFDAIPQRTPEENEMTSDIPSSYEENTSNYLPSEIEHTQKLQQEEFDSLNIPEQPFQLDSPSSTPAPATTNSSPFSQEAKSDTTPSAAASKNTEKTTQDPYQTLNFDSLKKYLKKPIIKKASKKIQNQTPFTPKEENRIINLMLPSTEQQLYGIDQMNSEEKSTFVRWLVAELINSSHNSQALETLERMFNVKPVEEVNIEGYDSLPWIQYIDRHDLIVHLSDGSLWQLEPAAEYSIYFWVLGQRISIQETNHPLFSFQLRNVDDGEIAFGKIKWPPNQGPPPPKKKKKYRFPWQSER